MESACGGGSFKTDGMLVVPCHHEDPFWDCKRIREQSLSSERLM